MRLLFTNLTEEFSLRLKECHSLDIAVAWATPCEAIEMALQRCRRDRAFRLRIVVGIAGSATSPIILKTMLGADGVCLRIFRDNHRLFHPKFFLFRRSARSFCWVGSSNLTASGFEANLEANVEFEDTSNEARQWFEKLWEPLEEQDTDGIIASYENNWTAREAASRSPIPPIRPEGTALDYFPNNVDWDEFIRRIIQCDSLWLADSQNNGDHQFGVLGDSWSWVDTIQQVGALARRADWTTLTNAETRMLMGMNHPNAPGGWGMLGRMGGAAAAVGAFYRNQNLRQEIRKALQKPINSVSEQEFIDSSDNFLNYLIDQPGFGIAIGTRLLALVRPDRAVSINGGSAPGYHEIENLFPSNAQAWANPNRNHYARFLRWVYDQPWYQTAPPEGGIGRIIWHMRAAILDCFAYQHPT